MGYLNSFLDFFSFWHFFPFACFSSFFSHPFFPLHFIIFPFFDPCAFISLWPLSTDNIIWQFFGYLLVWRFFPPLLSVHFISQSFLLLVLLCIFCIFFFFKEVTFSFSLDLYIVFKYKGALTSLPFLWLFTVDHLYCSSITLHRCCFSLCFFISYTQTRVLPAVTVFYVCCQNTCYYSYQILSFPLHVKKKKITQQLFFPPWSFVLFPKRINWFLIQ